MQFNLKNFVFLSFIVLVNPVYSQVQEGIASFYADKFEGQPTASGQKYRHDKFTAAHRTLPFGTKVKVIHIDNGNSVEVTINDRGPFIEGRVIDVSRIAAEKLGFVNQGLAKVRLEIVDPGDGKSTGPGKAIERVTVDEKEFYQVDTDRVNPKGFGVQIGTYQELVNLVRLVDNLKTSYRSEVTLQVKIIRGVKYYTLIIGQFRNRAKAEKLRDDLKNRFPDAFIVDFSKV